VLNLDHRGAPIIETRIETRRAEGSGTADARSQTPTPFQTTKTGTKLEFMRVRICAPKAAIKSPCLGPPLLRRRRLGFTRAAPRKLIREAYFLVRLTITIRYYPLRFFEFTAKSLASASVHWRFGFTQVTRGLQPQSPQPTAVKSARFYPCRLRTLNCEVSTSVFNSKLTSSVLPLLSSSN
jgi:hypothetical protein